jgi:ABC-type antimicrobial peptide transport system permease subunit
MDEYLATSVAQPRFSALLLAIFAGVALIMTAVGLYGVMAYDVTQRRHELGVRLALGARSRDVVGMVLRQGLTLTAVGIGIGLVGAVGLTRLLGGFLFGVSATDPLTFALIALLLGGVALLACLIPARRTTTVDPLVALRQE